MIEPIALYIGHVVVYWSFIVACMAVCAGFCLGCAVYTANIGRARNMLVYLPIACGLSYVFARTLHWYCHAEQYAGLAGALTDPLTGGYCVPGVLLGLWLAAVILRVFGLTRSIPRLLDALAPGVALGIALLRLCSLFDNSGRGKMVITDPRYQHLPLGAAVSTASGGVEYRFATFFIQFLFTLALAFLLLAFYYRRKHRRMKTGAKYGHTAMLFLLLHSASELVLDSTRYDASFFRSNGFVSVSQIVGALCILAVLVYYSVCSVRTNRLRIWHWGLWILYLATVGGVGYLEYLVQRHGDWYLGCYGGMSALCAVMALTVYIMYRTVCASGRQVPRHVQQRSRKRAAE